MEHSPGETEGSFGDDVVAKNFAPEKNDATSQSHCEVEDYVNHQGNGYGDEEDDDDYDSDDDYYYDEEPSAFEYSMDQVDWALVCGLGLLLLALKVTKRGRRRCAQHWNMLLFLVAATHRFTLFGHCKGLYSPSVWKGIVQSCKVFVAVHPTSSPKIIVCHFATYWPILASWRAKTLCRMLVYILLFETVTTFLNEYFHYDEKNEDIWYFRSEFVVKTGQFALDDVIRGYVLCPLLVYGYLLPKSILFCILNSISS